MYCKNCGNFVSQEENFCNQCGVKQETVNNKRQEYSGYERLIHKSVYWTNEKYKNMLFKLWITISGYFLVIVFWSFLLAFEVFKNSEGWLIGFLFILIILAGTDLAVKIVTIKTLKEAAVYVYENHVEGLAVVKWYTTMNLTYNQILDVQITGNEVCIITNGIVYKCAVPDKELLCGVIQQKLLENRQHS